MLHEKIGLSHVKVLDWSSLFVQHGTDLIFDMYLLHMQTWALIFPEEPGLETVACKMTIVEAEQGR